MTRPTLGYMRPARRTEKGNAPPRRRCLDRAFHGRARRGKTRRTAMLCGKGRAPPYGRRGARALTGQNGEKVENPLAAIVPARENPAGGVDATHDMRPDGKARRGHAGRVVDAEGKVASAALTIAPPRPCVPTLGVTFTRSPAMRPGRHPVVEYRPGCRAECDIARRGPSPPASAYASRQSNRARRASSRRTGPHHGRAPAAGRRHGRPAGRSPARSPGQAGPSPNPRS